MSVSKEVVVISAVRNFLWRSDFIPTREIVMVYSFGSMVLINPEKITVSRSSIRHISIRSRFLIHSNIGVLIVAVDISAISLWISILEKSSRCAVISP
jgi:hypothetical protein